MARSDKPARTAQRPAKVDDKGKGAKPAKADKAPKPSKASAKPAKPNPYQRFVRYLKDVRSEMKRVVWPNRQEVLNSSVVVVVTLLAAIAFVLVVDQVSSTVLLDWVPKLFGMGG